MISQLAVQILLAAVAGSVPSQATPSTLIWIPSTDIQPDGTLHLGLDSYSVPSGKSWPTDYGLTAGLLDGRAEVGVDYFGGADHPLFFNAKYLVLAESEQRPAVAVGLYNFGTETDVTDYNMVYGLAARTLGGLRLTAGCCRGNEKALGRDPDMLLLGVDGYLTRDRRWWGAVDYQSGKNAFGALSFGVSYAFSDNVSVVVGYDVFNDTALDDTLTTQVDINF